MLRTAAAICVLAALTGSGRDRLYVLVSPLEFVGPLAIVAFDVDAQGLLTQRESYPTGGSGSGGDSGQELTMHPSGRFLFAPNNASSSVSVFGIGTNGALSAVPGSPFATGNGPMALALSPDGQQAFVSEVVGEAGIGVFSVDSNGVMGPAQVVTRGGYVPRDLQVDSLGRCLYVVDMTAGLRVYDLHAPGGALREIPGSPFSGFRVSRPYYLQLSSDARRAFLLDLDAGLAAYNLGSNGAPSFQGVAGAMDYAEHLQLMPGNNLLYLGLPFQDWIQGFSIQSNGVPLQLTGSPFAAEANVVGCAASPNGSRLYAVTREGTSLQTFAVATNGSLTKLGNLQLSDVQGRSPNGVAYWTEAVGPVIGPLSVRTAP